MMMTLQEAAKYLRCSERKMHDLIHRDDGDPEKVPAYKVGRRVVLYEEELIEHLKSKCKV